MGKLLKFQGRLPYALLVVAVLTVDRWTKLLIQKRFELNESISVIDGLFNITYVRNTGVAFGIFSSISSPAKSILLSVLPPAPPLSSSPTACEVRHVTGCCKL